MGRRGHGVRGQLNGFAFESVIVPRSRRFYLLLPNELRDAAGIALGDNVQVALAPVAE
jgi:hypothetical protein